MRPTTLVAASAVLRSQCPTSSGVGRVLFERINARPRSTSIYRSSRYALHTTALTRKLPTTPTKPSDPSAQDPSPRHIPHAKALLLIHVPVPPARWPSVIGKASPFIFAIERAAAITGVRCLVVWDGKGQAKAFEEVPRDGEEGFEATLWRKDGEVVFIPRLDQRKSQLATFGDLLDGKRVDSLDGVDRLHVSKAEAKDILVCVHGARDCRCGDLGSPLVTALRAEIRKRQAGIRVLGCSHVGGHKFAANAIVLPDGHFLGNLRATDASAMLDFMEQPHGSVMWDKYRGSFLKTEAEQAEILEKRGA